jgi:hypothetical protein
MNVIELFYRLLIAGNCLIIFYKCFIVNICAVGFALSKGLQFAFSKLTDLIRQSRRLTSDLIERQMFENIPHIPTSYIHIRITRYSLHRWKFLISSWGY